VKKYKTNLETTMKKTVLLFAFTLGPAAVYAQSSVTLYGNIDTGFVLQSGGPKGWGVGMGSGVQDTNRWGLTGTEDLGNGWKTIFKLEEGYLSTTGAASVAGDAFNRGAYVGLSSPYGTVKAGRDYTPTYNTLGELTPFGNAFSGPSVLFAGEKGGTWASNQLIYDTPQLGGFNGVVTYSPGGAPGSLSDSQQFGYTLGYNVGTLRLEYTHYQLNNTTATDTSREDLLIARYDFGYAIAYFGFGADREPGSADFRDFHVGISKTWDVANVMYVAYEYKNDLDGHAKNVSGLIVNYLYYLSKRTNLYVAGMMLSNTRYSTTKNGSGSRELDVGICHLF
jgi:predicted porin